MDAESFGYGVVSVLALKGVSLGIYSLLYKPFIDFTRRIGTNTEAGGLTSIGDSISRQSGSVPRLGSFSKLEIGAGEDI